MYRYNSVCPQSPERKGRSGEDKDISQGYFAGFQCHDSKIDQNKIKKTVWERKKCKHAKTRVTAIFLQQDMRRDFLPKDLYGEAMLVPIRMGTNMAAGNQKRLLSLSFATKARIYLSGNS